VRSFQRSSDADTVGNFPIPKFERRRQNVCRRLRSARERKQGEVPMRHQLELFALPTSAISAEDRATKRVLNRYYSNESNFNFEETKTDGIHFPDGTWRFMCSNWARYTRRLEGKTARIYGFQGEENPLSLIAVQCGGHDFAVVAGRFIVDGWAICVSGYSRSAVFDLLDPMDKKAIRELYGDPAYWLKKCRNTALECDVDRESADARARAFVGVAPRISKR
jgi:hypothetical protein